MVERKNSMSNLIDRNAVIDIVGKSTSNIMNSNVIDIINKLPCTQSEIMHMLKREPIKNKSNCPNCGAPITGTECPYCGSVFGC